MILLPLFPSYHSFLLAYPRRLQGLQASDAWKTECNGFLEAVGGDVMDVNEGVGACVASDCDGMPGMGRARHVHTHTRRVSEVCVLG